MRDKKFSSVGRVLDPTDLYHTSRFVDTIIVHCTATPFGRDVDANDIDKMHLARWGRTSGIGYHYLVKEDGTLEKGRWADNIGAHAKGKNNGSIGIAYSGGLDSNLDVVEDGLSTKQRETLVTTLKTLKDLYNVKISNIVGHKEIKGVHKACPCMDMDKLREDVTK